MPGYLTLAALVAALLCSNTDSPFSLVMRVYGYGLCLCILEGKWAPRAHDPLLDELIAMREVVPARCKLISMVATKSRVKDLASVPVSEYETDAAHARDAMDTARDACIDVVAGILHRFKCYKKSLTSNPLFVAAEKLEMEWLIDRFCSPLLLLCSDGAVAEKRWVLEKLAYFRSSHALNPYTQAYEVDWRERYSVGAVTTFLRLVRGEASQINTDRGMFLELLQIIGTCAYEADVRAELYNNLVIYGVLGTHSRDIFGVYPMDGMIASVLDTMTTKQWYFILKLITEMLDIAVVVDSTSVKLTTGPACNYINLVDRDFTKIKTFRYDMSIDLCDGTSPVSLPTALELVLSRVTEIDELEFFNVSGPQMDPATFSRVFQSPKGVTKLEFTGMTTVSLRMTIGLLRQNGIRELTIREIPLNDDLSFLLWFPPLERLSMISCGLTAVFLDVLSGARGPTGLSWCCTPGSPTNVLSKLVNLRVLNMPHNNFVRLADFSFVMRLPVLEELYMSYCKLTTSSLCIPPAAGVHRSLRVLNLYKNSLSGPLDPSFQAGFQSLEMLNVKCPGTSYKSRAGLKGHAHHSRAQRP